MHRELIEKDGFVRIGKIRCAHGIRGELFLISYTKNFDWLYELEELGLVIKCQDEEGQWQENKSFFQIQKLKKHKVGQIIKLAGVNDRNRAEEFIGAQLEVAKELFEQMQEDGSYYLRALKGFQIIDQASNSIGPVMGFANNGAQDILLVEHKGEEVGIPYVDDFIVKKNFKEKWIRMELPQGLLGE